MTKQTFPKLAAFVLFHTEYYIFCIYMHYFQFVFYCLPQLNRSQYWLILFSEVISRKGKRTVASQFQLPYRLTKNIRLLLQSALIVFPLVIQYTMHGVACMSFQETTFPHVYQFLIKKNLKEREVLPWTWFNNQVC